MKARVRHYIDFLGWPVATNLMGSFCLSFFIYLTESLFAYSILLFLVKLDFIKEALPEQLNVFSDASLDTTILILTGAALLRGVTWWSLQFFIGALTQQFRYIFRKRITRGLLEGRLSSTPDALALFTEKTNESAAMLIACQTTVVHSILAFTYLATLLYISFYATALAFLGICMILLPLSLLQKRVRRSGDVINAEWDRVNRQLMLAFNNLFFLNISGMVEKTKSAAENSLKNFLDHFLSFHRYAAFAMVGPQIGGIIVLVFTIKYAAEGEWISKAMLVPYFYLFLRFVQAGAAAFSRFSEVSFKWPQVKTLYNWWVKDESVRMQNFEEETEMQIELDHPLGFAIRHLSFHYAPDKPVFQDYSLTIPSGKTLVITGRSGSGKSTLLKLLLGIERPSGGSVELVNGSERYPTHTIKHSLWRHIGYVGADSYMIAGTIHENLCFGLEASPPKEDIEKCLKAADCDFVWEQPKGIEYLVSEGGDGLSTGQRQRLGLARALLRRPKALVLDEFTANLDLQSQDHLLSSIRQYGDSMTVIIVSHRPEVLGLADIHVSLAAGKEPVLELT